MLDVFGWEGWRSPPRSCSWLLSAPPPAIEVSTGEGSTSFEDDAEPTVGWTVAGAPQDDQGIEGANRNDWVRRQGLGIKEGAAVATPDTLYTGFGVEGITGAGTRNQVMDRAIDYFLPGAVSPQPLVTRAPCAGATKRRALRKRGVRPVIVVTRLSEIVQHRALPADALGMNQIELITRDGSLLHVRAYRGLADLLATGGRTGNVGVFDVDRQRWSWLTLADVALVAS
jgi:hypothetical protein